MYKRFELTCENARTNQVLVFGGNFNSFVIARNDIPISYRVNLPTADLINSDELTGFENEGLMKRLYLTHAAGTVTDKIVVIAFGS